jgi:D-beta-D-heptose 7-phosphate kinase/D-beta-D-heptose 1-phosphate adenosyltransferase
MKKNKKKQVAISGGFDPVHVGHVRMIQSAAKFGDVIVICNSDAWLKRKKGYFFMPFTERAEILRAFEGVKDVIEADDDDGSVCETLKVLQPDIFANGGDRFNTNTPETQTCKKYAIEMLWGVGGGKIQSSSDLVANMKRVKLDD